MFVSLGREWLVDAGGCKPEHLRDVVRLQDLCNTILGDLGLHVVGECLWHRFPEPGGVTGLYLLTESHLAVHTYPEYQSITFSLYCCKSRPRWPWEQHLRVWLDAKRVHVRTFRRGVSGPRGPCRPVDLHEVQLVENHER